MRLTLFLLLAQAAFGQPLGWQYDVPPAWAARIQKDGVMMRPPGNVKMSLGIATIPSNRQTIETQFRDAAQQFVGFRPGAPPRVWFNPAGVQLASGYGPLTSGGVCQMVIATRDRSSVALLITAESAATMERYRQEIDKVIQTLKYAKVAAIIPAFHPARH